MEPTVTLDQSHAGGRTTREKIRNRRPLPPRNTRDWLTPRETAHELGCSVATVHRRRRGLVPNIEPLPCSQYGRKFVFRKASIARWLDHNEKKEPPSAKVARDSGNRGRGAGKARAHDHKEGYE